MEGIKTLSVIATQSYMFQPQKQCTSVQEIIITDKKVAGWIYYFHLPKFVYITQATV